MNLLQDVLLERRGELLDALKGDLLERDAAQALDEAALLLIQPARQLFVEFSVVAVPDPVLVGDRQSVAELFLEQRLLVDLIRTLENAVPEFEYLVDVLMDLVRRAPPS